MTAALYTPLEAAAGGEVFDASELTGSAWGPNMQHAGPVAALTTRAMERLPAPPGTRIARVHLDILGPVPLDRVRVAAEVARPGRRVSLLTASFEVPTADRGWRTVARARAWRLATQPTPTVAHRADPAVAFPTGDRATPDAVLPERWQRGFVSALEFRLVGPLGVPGQPTVAWLRLMVPVVAGEKPSGLQQVMAIADTANGVGARIDYHRWTYLNTDLSVVVFEAPHGPWFGLAAETSVGGDGVGMSSAALHQESGPMGRLTQTLLVEKRAEPLDPD